MDIILTLSCLNRPLALLFNFCQREGLQIIFKLNVIMFGGQPTLFFLIYALMPCNKCSYLVTWIGIICI